MFIEKSKIFLILNINNAGNKNYLVHEIISNKCTYFSLLSDDADSHGLIFSKDT